MRSCHMQENLSSSADNGHWNFSKFGENLWNVSNWRRIPKQLATQNKTFDTFDRKLKNKNSI